MNDLSTGRDLLKKHLFPLICHFVQGPSTNRASKQEPIKKSKDRKTRPNLLRQ